MPRRKLIRRFEPRYGVSEPMLTAEATYVERELNDYLLESTTDLRQRLQSSAAGVGQAEAELQALFSRLPERTQLGLRSMFVRDCLHLALLYQHFLKSTSGSNSEAFAATSVQTGARNAVVTPPANIVLPFKETLFE